MLPSLKKPCDRYLTYGLSRGAGAVRRCYWRRLRRVSFGLLVRAMMTYSAASRCSYGAVVSCNVACYTTDGSPF
jgi:hypothetical protein